MNSQAAHDLRNAEIREEHLLDLLSQHGISPDSPSTAEIKYLVESRIIQACLSAGDYNCLVRCEDMTPKEYISEYIGACESALGGNPELCIQKIGLGLLSYEDTLELIAVFKAEATITTADALEHINERRYQLGYNSIM
jgi:hypothetical protein